LSQQLDPVELKAGKLTDHLADLAAGISQRFKVACHFECSLAGSPEDDTVATQLFRIAQEAVLNAVKHGRSAHINICLDAADDEMVLTITDDGLGLPEKIPGGASLGLRTMAYRADLIGATLNLERLSTRGTRVTCALPMVSLHEKQHAAQN
jgi:signal transduction histidine kinase